MKSTHFTSYRAYRSIFIFGNCTYTHILIFRLHMFCWCWLSPWLLRRPKMCLLRWIPVPRRLFTQRMWVLYFTIWLLSFHGQIKSQKYIFDPIFIKFCGKNRVATDFKHWKFIPALAFSYSLGKKTSKKARIFQIGPHLDMSVCDQNFST